jgi:hypothetical protein
MQARQLRAERRDVPAGTADQPRLIRTRGTATDKSIEQSVQKK